MKSNAYPDLDDWSIPDENGNPNWRAMLPDYEDPDRCTIRMEAAAVVALEMVTLLADATKEDVATLMPFLQKMYERVVWENSPYVVSYLITSLADICTMVNGFDSNHVGRRGEKVHDHVVGGYEPDPKIAVESEWFRLFVACRLTADEAGMRNMLKALTAGHDMDAITKQFNVALTMTVTTFRNRAEIRRLQAQANAEMN